MTDVQRRRLRLLWRLFKAREDAEARARIVSEQQAVRRRQFHTWLDQTLQRVLG